MSDHGTAISGSCQEDLTALHYAAFAGSEEAVEASVGLIGDHPNIGTYWDLQASRTSLFCYGTKTLDPVVGQESFALVMSGYDLIGEPPSS